MQSIFPQFGNANGGASNSSLISFKAGKMIAESKSNGKFLVKADERKGLISLIRGNDQLVHFQWKDRTNGTIPDDFIVLPEDATFKKVSTGRDEDRVYLLQYKNSERRFFFWMQSKDKEKDEANAEKVNEIMNSAASSNSTSGRNNSNGTQLDQNALMQMLGAMGGNGTNGPNSGGQTGNGQVQMSDLQSILQSMGLPPRNENSNTQESTTASTNNSTTNENSSTSNSNQQVPSSNTISNAAPTTGTSSTSDSGTSSQQRQGGTITTEDFQRAMRVLQQQQMGGPSVSLSKLFQSNTNILSKLSSQDLQELMPFLPPTIQTESEVYQTLHTPQFQQCLGSLTHALQTSNFNAIMSNFGLDPAAGASKLAQGDGVGAFLDAIQQWANSQQQ